MKSFRSLCSSHPVVIAIITFIIGCVLLQVLTPILELIPGFTGQIIERIILLAVMFIIIVIVAGPKIISPRGRMMGFTFRKCWWILAVNLLLLLVMLAMQIVHVHTPLVPDWVLRAVEVLILCLFVGLFEDSMFRGVILNGLVARMGNTRAGLVWAAVITSLLFGFTHVLGSLITGGVADITTIEQSIGKTLETAMFAFVLSAVYLKTHNIWGVAIIHGLSDFFPTLYTALFSTSAISATYVDASAGMNSVGAYAGIAIVYIPLVIIGWHILRDLKLPQTGFFGKPDWADTASVSVPHVKKHK
jgi:membrane protease YdiL (CAAX protease family)